MEAGYNYYLFMSVTTVSKTLNSHNAGCAFCLLTEREKINLAVSHSQELPVFNHNVASELCLSSIFHTNLPIRSNTVINYIHK